MMQKGIDNKISLVKELEKICKVFITSEGPLPKQLEPYKIHIPPELMHDALYYASLYIGEGGTMASECAVLGTPAIYVNSLPLGYLNEQQDNYKLIKIMNEYDENLLISYAIELISDTNIKLSKKASQRYIRDNIDVTAFMVNTIQNIELPQINK
jgi:predicted glycosyltransferase